MSNKPEYYNRHLNLKQLLNDKSYFLFGPRGTGKSFLINEQLKDSCLIINLLKADIRLRLLANPSELSEIIEASNHKFVVIDEIQKIPELLDEVHRLIEDQKIKFLLTGSSARKLKKSGVNLLAGRAYRMGFFPLTYHEIKNFDLNKYLLYGGLPASYSEGNPTRYLSSYCKTYLEEEIQAEALTRSVPNFFRFLKSAALMNGQLINYSKVAQDAQIKVHVVKSYFEILKDTLIAESLQSWSHSNKRKAIETSKFYFFDIGVANYLSDNRSLPVASDLYGRAFEHFIYQEIKAYLSYAEKDEFFGYWRTKHGHEVDFIIGDHTAIEVKSTKKISSGDLKSLYYLKEEEVFKKYYLVSQDPIERKVDHIHIIPWKSFLKKLWASS